MINQRVSTICLVSVIALFTTSTSLSMINGAASKIENNTKHPIKVVSRGVTINKSKTYWGLVKTGLIYQIDKNNQLTILKSNKGCFYTSCGLKPNKHCKSYTGWYLKLMLNNNEIAKICATPHVPAYDNTHSTLIISGCKGNYHYDFENTGMRKAILPFLHYHLKSGAKFQAEGNFK